MSFQQLGVLLRDHVGDVAERRLGRRLGRLGRLGWWVRWLLALVGQKRGWRMRRFLALVRHQSIVEVAGNDDAIIYGIPERCFFKTGHCAGFAVVAVCHFLFTNSHTHGASEYSRLQKCSQRPLRFYPD